MSGSTAAFPVLYTCDGTTTGLSIEYDDLAEYVNMLAKNQGVTQVKIVGNRTYVEPTVDDIRAIAAQEYSNNNLEIEVIEQ